MREEKYLYPRLGAYFTALSGERNKVPSLRELSRSVCLYSPSPISPETADNDASRGIIACFAAN